MKFKLSNNEPFQIDGIVNNQSKTIDVLNDVATVIEATGTLPAVATKGTICKLTIDSVEKSEVENGDIIGDTIYVEGLKSMYGNGGKISNYFYENYTGNGFKSEFWILRDSYPESLRLYLYLYETYEEIDVTVVDEDNDVLAFDVSNIIPTNNSAMFDISSEVAGDNIVIYKTYEKTSTTSLYISDGEAWQQLTPSLTTEDPDGTVEEVDDIPISGGGNDSGNGSGTPTIYCEVRSAAGDDEDLGTVLIVKGADDFLTNEYVPILLRNSNKKNGRGWHHYKTSDNGDGGSSNFCTIDDVIVADGFGANSRVAELSAKGVKLENDFDILSYMPAAHGNGDEKRVSHGKRTIRLLRTGDNIVVHVSFKAKWGLAFIKASDFPASNVRLDVAKLVTNIAPFYVYYRWGSIESNGSKVWTLNTCLIT